MKRIALLFLLACCAFVIPGTAAADEPLIAPNLSLPPGWTRDGNEFQMKSKGIGVSMQLQPAKESAAKTLYLMIRGLLSGDDIGLQGAISVSDDFSTAAFRMRAMEGANPQVLYYVVRMIDAAPAHALVVSASWPVARKPSPQKDVETLIQSVPSKNPRNVQPNVTAPVGWAKIGGLPGVQTTTFTRPDLNAQVHVAWEEWHGTVQQYALRTTKLPGDFGGPVDCQANECVLGARAKGGDWILQSFRWARGMDANSGYVITVTGRWPDARKEEAGLDFAKFSVGPLAPQ